LQYTINCKPHQLGVYDNNIRATCQP